LERDPSGLGSASESRRNSKHKHPLQNI